ncbi:MAG: magnesium transporter [Planctomycetaceae bacterium]|nr:magnesium transporter [Planctomycetaceae bacterium]
MTSTTSPPASDTGTTIDIGTLACELATLAPPQAVERLQEVPVAVRAQVLVALSPAISEEILLAMSDETRADVFAAFPQATRAQWTANLAYHEDSIGRLMEPAHVVFRPDLTVAEAVERIRKLSRSILVTYGFIVDPHNHLTGVVAMRDLLLATPQQTMQEIMIARPFFLNDQQTLLEAMRLVVNKHFPVYPVCNSEGRLVGTVRGRTLFEEHAFEISAQMGTMVGVEKEERLSTPLATSFRFRHPWLQINLLTAFVAAAVVGFFQSTIDKMVVLAVFLPVLSGQSGNTGCQSLAVTLRGLTLGDLQPGREKFLVFKEGLLGLFNGILVGLSAAVGMMVYAWSQGNPAYLQLGAIVWVAMIGSCIVSGIAGATIPLFFRKIGADPATASSIFLTTATDVVSMGLFLGLAWLIFW